jgi:GNAT superfamily N-acetyltransferase
MHIVERIAETYAWYQGYGNEVDEEPLATYVRNPQHPDVWVANHLSRVRAQHLDEVEQVLAQTATAFAHCSQRMVIVDPFTPQQFVARLALEDYRELTPLVQMVLDGPVARPGANVELRAVVSDADWDELYKLVRADQIEGKRTHHLELDESITRGMVEGYRAKRAVQQFFLALERGEACAYGSAVVGPCGIGVVEDLYTSPSHRKRGIATALIHQAVVHAREHGMASMLIGTHASEPPKRLYAALGFRPTCMIRHYLKADL